ncbi:hypothetical protein OpiT1DRAFT_00099 [Opitutaceae bacterium TAV1]|nr:hypothetical protein OpiT1DRAFT_00099 [Opitutaceae bacterium TAV1]
MKRISCLLLALASCASLPASVLITGFGSDDFFDAGSELALTQTETTSRFVGSTLTGSILGTFATSVDISGYTSALALTATVSDINSSIADFQLMLWDGTDDGFYGYQGNWNQFVTGEESTVLLTAMAGQPDTFDFTAIQGLMFYFDSGADGTIDLTLNTLAAVPEPATCAILAGLACLGYIAARGRRR